MVMVPTVAITETRVLELLENVKDPEVPAISVVELGVVRGVEVKDDRVRRVGEGTVSVAAAKGDLVRLNDCVEVIRWYQTLIYVKVCRAFSSLVEEEDDRRLAAARDSSGSAKIALIALERSLAAWVALREMFPEETDSILEILVHLDRLRRTVKKKFPRAKSFKRPGFDDKG